MNRLSRLQTWTAHGCLALSLISGCTPARRFAAWRDQKDTAYFQSYVTQIEFPDVSSHSNPEVINAPFPLTIENPSELPTWDLTLPEAVHMALQTSDVLRTLGGSVVTAPQGTQTTLDPGITEANPQNGVEAALAAFDAQVSTQLFWQRNNRANNQNLGFIPGLGDAFPAQFQQTTANSINQIAKITATGTRFAFRHNIIYDRSDVGGRLFPSAYSGFLEAEMRQPLLQGSGTTYNRIAGPSGVVGQYNGVLIARINTDVSLADFEQGVITLMNDVETAYWELYYAYRALESQVQGRESSLLTWQRINALVNNGFRDRAAEAQARSQYYSFRGQVNDSLSGPNGLYAAEQRLRYIMGLPPSDGRLIRPSEQPIQAEVSFDWQRAVCDATSQRVEIRRQKWNIKRRELELIAARMNRRPRLDLLTQYRWRGLGDHLIDSRDAANQFDNLYQNIFEGNYQEWQAGVELGFPVGLRQASAGIRNAQLNLARETALLDEQELRILHDLSNASRQIARSYEQVQIQYNRVKAETIQVEVFTSRVGEGLGSTTTSGGRDELTLLLLATQTLANSNNAYFRALADYSLALRDFHREKGSLLSYNQVQLSEAGWNAAAHRDAYQRGRFFTPRENPSAVEAPAPISHGPFDPSTIGL